MALCGPGTPRNVRPTARARGLPDGVARCGSLAVLTWVSVTCGARAGSAGGLFPCGLVLVLDLARAVCRPAAASVLMVKYDTCARTLYANSVPPRGAPRQRA